MMRLAGVGFSSRYSAKPCSYGSLNQAADLRIAQLALGLTLELRVAEFN